ncbi:ribosomal protein S18-alanine N-acetyltransferase [Neptuniibacter halophilus]|uniref:ribosomal protein S18-alanine N-acetyltransferase n=1 Tax=Neptuniibacter halophilus TaxID=651666 RepID=UPI002573EAB6|nr:ribosomal protein S18-alanine N-acetyltransferase [Neptuniibacter halophilus]
MRAEIRLLRAEDLPALSALEQQCFTSAWSESQLMQRVLSEKGLALGLFTPALSAFALFSTLLDEAELLQVAVLPESQGQGLGRNLLDASLGMLSNRQVERVLLEVRASNLPAIALYHRLGFAEDGRRKGYYPPAGSQGTREDALLMSLSLHH